MMMLVSIPTTSDSPLDYPFGEVTFGGATRVVKVEVISGERDVFESLVRTLPFVTKSQRVTLSWEEPLIVVRPCIEVIPKLLDEFFVPGFRVSEFCWMDYLHKLLRAEYMRDMVCIHLTTGRHVQLGVVSRMHRPLRIFQELVNANGGFSSPAEAVRWLTPDRSQQPGIIATIARKIEGELTAVLDGFMPRNRKDVIARLDAAHMPSSPSGRTSIAVDTQNYGLVRCIGLWAHEDYSPEWAAARLVRRREILNFVRSRPLDAIRELDAYRARRAAELAARTDGRSRNVRSVAPLFEELRRFRDSEPFVGWHHRPAISAATLVSPDPKKILATLKKEVRSLPLHIEPRRRAKKGIRNYGNYDRDVVSGNAEAFREMRGRSEAIVGQLDRGRGALERLAAANYFTDHHTPGVGDAAFLQSANLGGTADLPPSSGRRTVPSGGIRISGAAIDAWARAAVERFDGAVGRFIAASAELAAKVVSTSAPASKAVQRRPESVSPGISEANLNEDINLK